MMFEQTLKCRCQAHKESGGISRTSKFFIQEAKPHYAPDRLVDVEHIKLEIRIDLKEKKLTGWCTQSFIGVAPVSETITFDAVDLVVRNVTDEKDRPIEFEQTESKLIVTLAKTVRQGERKSVKIKYEVTQPRAGLYFIAPDKHDPKRPMQLWTQGQDEDNRYWIPCHDSPNEKATSEMIVTVDEKYTAVSNGSLVRTKRGNKTRTWHYKMDFPHSSYLITLCIGEFVLLEESWKNSAGRKIPVQYFTLKGREAETRLSFGKTPKMIQFFSEQTGIDYPYTKYAQIVAWDFIYGGMENISSTTQTEYTLHPQEVEPDYDSEGLVAHELAHQWFGDLLTCKEWAHAWLNEGFATYCEALWSGHEHGKNEMLYHLYMNERSYKSEDSGDYRRPIVTNVFMAPSNIFDRHLYEKGGRILHMLKHLAGDDLWWKAINRYLMQNYAKTVETVDLQRAFEETTGLSLSWFFDQWIFKAGHPECKVGYEWDQKGRVAKFTITQTQKTDDLTPVFRFPIRFKICVKGKEHVFDGEVRGLESVFAFSVAAKPDFVSVNVENTVLGQWDFNPGRLMLMAQLKSDSDIMGKIHAAQTLAKEHSLAVVEALSKALMREKFWGVQVQIAGALGEIPSELAYQGLLASLTKIKHPRVRAAVMRALGNFKKPETALSAEKILKSDLSPLTQYEAGVALGKSGHLKSFEKLTALLGVKKSWHDYHDQGLLMGLAELKQDSRVLDVLIEHTKPWHSMFIRRTAVSALANHANARPELAVDYLINLLKDENFFVRIAAVDALERLKDQRAALALRALSDRSVEPRTKRSALLAAKALRDSYKPNEQVEKLKLDFDGLRSQYKELLTKVQKLEGQKFARLKSREGRKSHQLR